MDLNKYFKRINFVIHLAAYEHKHGADQFMTREEAKRKIFKYVEMYYNRKRVHSTLGYLSPFEYEKQKFFLNN
ncbi:MAG: IS3 family transposase [Elusimicrobiota bacterium]